MKKMFLRMQKLNTLCDKLQVSFKDISLLDQALIHSSFAHEAKFTPKPRDNERLEFLGDAVLGLSVSSYIYENFGDMTEGEMTKLRAKVVCEAALAKYAREINLGEYMLLGKGEAASGGRNRSSILANAMEAVFGAYYLDQGFARAKELILALAKKEIDVSAGEGFIDDYKTKFQELVQQDSSYVITYELLAEEGPAHEKIFSMAVLVNGEKIACGQGTSKKEAEQMAAKRALIKY